MGEEINETLFARGGAAGVGQRFRTAVTPEQVFDEMSHEMVECSVYFTTVTVGLQNSNDLALAERYERAGKMLVQWR